MDLVCETPKFGKLLSEAAAHLRPRSTPVAVMALLLESHVNMLFLCYGPLTLLYRTQIHSHLYTYIYIQTYRKDAPGHLLYMCVYVCIACNVM